MAGGAEEQRRAVCAWFDGLAHCRSHGLPTTVRLARSCPPVSAVVREALFSNFLPTLTALRRGLPTVLTNATSPGPDRQKTLV